MFKNGNKNGIQKINYPSGKLFSIEEYKDGKSSGKKEDYYKAGQLHGLGYLAAMANRVMSLF